MTAHLLALAIGPVQDFIQAARRTRDLWFGSQLLSEVSAAAARRIGERIAAATSSGPSTAGENSPGLVFPALLDSSAAASSEKSSVANVMIAVLPAGLDSQTVADDASQAARECWESQAKSAMEMAHRQGAIDLARGQAQAADVIECYAAWVPLDDSAGAFQRARAQAMRLLAGRKQCRDFVAGAGEAGVPKSSLDGGRESILLRDMRGSDELRLARGEELDVVGLTKRLAGGKAGYPSITRVAVDPWLRGVAAAALECPQVAADWKALLACCDQLAPRILSRVKDPTYALFPFEGTAVLPDRYPAMWEEAGRHDPQDDRRGEKLRQDPDYRELTRVVGKLRQSCGEPFPYAVALAADGDKLGAAIRQLRTANENRELSRRLATFASEARRIVAACHGFCVYAGGDDVFGFLPLDQCLAAAHDLMKAFGGLWDGFRLDAPPTLSVGLAIAHCQEHMEDLRSFGFDAERRAKQPDRNGLAVTLRTRGADVIAVRERWDEASEGNRLDQRLAEWAGMFVAGALPGKLPYDLLGLVREYGDGAPWKGRTDDLLQALCGEVRQMTRRKREGGKLALQAQARLAARMSQSARLASASPAQRHPADVLRFFDDLASEMQISQQIAASYPRPTSRSPAPDEAADAGETP